ncbi:hypothetical protein Tco_0590588 [Tanacetum coccineum]
MISKASRTFSNPLFENTDDFLSGNDESILKEEVHEEALKSYLNPLFEKDEEIISNEASRQISPKVDVKAIIHEVFKSDNENDLGIHDNMERNCFPCNGLLEDENFFEMNDKKGKIFDPGITIHGKSFDKDAFKDKSSKELAPSKALLTLDVFDPLHPPLMDFHVTKAFFGFTFSILKIFSKKSFDPGIKNAMVMAILVISISLDSSEDSVGTPAGRVILFGTIPTTIPDTTPVITPPATQTDTPSDPSEDPSSDHIPPLPAISPFLSSDDDTTDSDTPDTPPSPTHGTPFTEITASTQRSPIIPRRRVMILLHGQPIPHGRLYRYHLNGPVHMITARKRVGPLPTHRLAVRHYADHSSSDLSSEASSDFHSDASSDPSSRRSLSDHSSPDVPGTSAGPSSKRRRSPTTSVPALSPVSGALSLVRADLIPSPNRVKDSGYLADVEVDHREISLRDDAIVKVSDEPHLEQDTDPEIQAEIDEYTGVRGPVEVRVERVTHPMMPEDIPKPAQEGAVEATYETLGDLVQRIVRVESAVIALIKRIAELERDNRRLRDTVSVENALRDRGIDARVVVETIDRDETKTGVRGPVKVRVKRVTHPVMPEDIPEPAQEGAVEATYETLGDLVQRFLDHTQVIPIHRIQAIEGVQREQGHRIVGVESAVIALTERIAELERDNKRLRDTVSVESQRVDRLQRGMSRMQRELRQMRQLRFYDRVRVGRLEAYARKYMGYRP